MRLIDLVLVLVSLFFGIFAVYKVKFSNQPPSILQYIKRQVFDEPIRDWPHNPPNPLPLKKSRSANNSKVYVAVIDFDNEPGHHYCQMKKQWMTPLTETDLIDSIEVYSLKYWHNTECDIKTVTVPKPKFDTLDYSTWILRSTLALFLERSNSGWLFITGDSVYVKTNEFIEYLKVKMKTFDGLVTAGMYGGCVEKRYFFQMFTPESGVLISRKAVKKLVANDMNEVWDVVMEVGIHYDEALAQLSDQIGIYVQGRAQNVFLGREFRNATEQFKWLENKNFDNLIPCEVPYEYIRNAPGELGVCSSHVTRFDSIITWSGAGYLNKTEFLEKAETFLGNNPSDLGFYWDRTNPTLCRIGLSNIRL